MLKIVPLFASLLLTLSAAAQEPSPAASSARTRIVVDCSSPRAPIRTVAEGLRALGDARPAVLLISGTCRENVTVGGLDRVTLQGNPTAIIDGGGNPDLDAVLISDSSSIDLVDLTITGGGDGVACDQCRARLTRVTLRGSLGPGAVTGTGAQLLLSDSAVLENGDSGVVLNHGSVMRISNTRFSGNAGDGIFLNGVGSTLATFGCTINGNHGNGVSATLHGSVLLNTTTVTGNDGDGVWLGGGSSMRSSQSTIGSNGGHQIRIGDLSYAQFSARSVVSSGGAFPDVVCDPVFSAVRGLGNLPGVTTSCPDELPRTP